MKKKYISGFLTGLCGALLIIVVITLSGCSKLVDFNGNGNDDLVESQEKGKEPPKGQDAKSEDYDQVMEKLAFLEYLVDNLYLEDVDQDKLAEGIYKGFIGSLNDPYSTYYTEEEYKSLMESSSGIYCGIGATVSQDVSTGIITVVKPFKDGPAYKAGLLPGDIIYKVEGEEVTGVDLTEVVSRMKGVEGTRVTISIVREGESEPMDFTITRREIEVPTIEVQMLKDKIGYIIVSEFDEVTVAQFVEAVDQLEKEGMKGLVVDLRNNPGGLLSSVVNMLDRILPKGLIVYTEDKNGKREEENATNDDKLNVPLAVIINGNSASASEIFAGAVQDYEVGTIVGTTSFGKGIVQKVIPLSDGTAVKLTISKYFTPKGRNIHGTGIVPDIEVELPENLKREVTIPLDQDTQLQEAIRVVKDKIKQ